MITILITTYNSGEYISNVIISVLKQTFRNFEILIIDDGSTDNTARIISEFKDSRIKYIYNAHSGRSKALNFGLRNCKYDWVAILDADDIVHTNWLELQYNLFTFNQNEIVICQTAFFYKRKIFFISNFDIHNVRQRLALHMDFPHSGTIFNRDFIIEHDGYNENLKVGIDYDLFLKILPKINFFVQKKVLVFQRKNQNSISRYNYSDTRKGIYNIQSKYNKNFKSHFQLSEEKKIFEILGWREFYYGSPIKAMLYWMKWPTLFLNFKIILASIVSIFPNRIVDLLITKNWYNRFRIKTKEEKLLQEEFNDILISIKNNEN